MCSACVLLIYSVWRADFHNLPPMRIVTNEEEVHCTVLACCALLYYSGVIVYIVVSDYRPIAYSINSGDSCEKILTNSIDVCVCCCFITNRLLFSTKITLANIS